MQHFYATFRIYYPMCVHPGQVNIRKSIETLFVLIVAIKPKCSSTNEQTPANSNRNQFVESNVNPKQMVRKCYIQCIFFHLSMKSRWLSVQLSNVHPQGEMNTIYLCSYWSHGHNVCDADQCQICGLLDVFMSVDVMNIH